MNFPMELQEKVKEVRYRRLVAHRGDWTISIVQELAKETDESFLYGEWSPDPRSHFNVLGFRCVESLDKSCPNGRVTCVANIMIPWRLATIAYVLADMLNDAG